MNENLFFVICVAVLGLALFFPVNKLIWVLSIRRLEKKYKKKLAEIDRKGQLNRSRFITIIVVAVFSYLFNLNIF